MLLQHAGLYGLTMVRISCLGISAPFPAGRYIPFLDDYNTHKGMAARSILAYAKIVQRPLSKGLPPFIETLGDHIRKKRIETSRMQRDVAQIIGVSEDTITGWENNRYQPQLRHYPAIIAFIGYYPFKHETGSFAGKIRLLRFSKGYSYKQLGLLLGVNGSTARGWEQAKNVPTKRHMDTVDAFIQQSLKQQYPST